MHYAVKWAATQGCPYIYSSGAGELSQLMQWVLHSPSQRPLPFWYDSQNAQRKQNGESSILNAYSSAPLELIVDFIFSKFVILPHFPTSDNAWSSSQTAIPAFVISAEFDQNDFPCPFAILAVTFLLINARFSGRASSLSPLSVTTM